MKRKLYAAIIAVFAMLGLGLSAPMAFAPTAHAAPATHTTHALHLVSGACWDWPDSGHPTYLNAWNNGPYVNVYHACANPQGYFTIIYNGPYVQLEYTGSGSWVGNCIGDANNDPTHANTSLDGCGSNPGWGVDLTILTTGYCGGGQAAFRDAHWSQTSGGYLGPGSPYGDGTPFYLNKGGYFCFYLQ